jgi:hypothetical protein
MERTSVEEERDFSHINKELNTSFGNVCHWIGVKYSSEVFYIRLLLTYSIPNIYESMSYITTYSPFCHNI